MLVPTLVMGALACGLFALAYRRGGGEHIEGMRLSWNLLVQVLPLLVFAFTVAGLVQVLLPAEQVSRWVGAESGARGIALGTLAGALTPGGPFVTLPVAAGLLKAGASVGTMVAFVTSWSLWAVMRLPLEVGIMGWRFTVVRLACTFFFPPLAGLMANRLFSGWV